MKYLVFIFFICFGSVLKAQQTWPNGIPTQFSTGYFRHGYDKSDSGTIIALRDTTWLPKFSGTVVFRPQTRLPYYYDSTNLRWYPLVTTPSDSSFYYIDYIPQITNPSYNEGRLWYDNGNKTLSLYDAISGTSLQIGQEQYVRARNSTGSQINDGSVVYVNGATGLNPTIALAKSNSASTSRTIGLATHNIANNTVGKITTFGVVNDINTIAFNAGDRLYISPTVAGTLTNIEPDVPNFSVFVGYCLNSHVTQGKILITPQQTIVRIYQLTDTSFIANVGTLSDTIRIVKGSGGGGTVTSVGLSMPSAFSVSGSPITTSGTIAVSGAGTSLQYIRGNGTLATFDTSAIPNFYIKARSLLSGTSPITYNSTTGVIGINNANTSGTKGAATFNGSDFTDNGSGTISLRSIGSAGSCLNCQLSIDTKGRITSYADGSGGAVSLNNIGSGNRWLATPSGNFKTVSASNTIYWDSTSNSNALTAKADTSVLATQYDILTRINNANLDTVLRIGNIGMRGTVIGDSIIVQTDSSIFYGNSVTAGQNASTIGNRYVNLTCTNLKTTPINRGISGTTLQSVGGSGDSSMIGRLYTIPIWRNTLRYIMFDYGINDCDLDLGIAGFGSAYRRVIDTCIARGWPLSRIVVITPSIIGLNSFGKNIDSLRPFADTALAVAKAKGVHYADVFHYMIANGGTSALVSSDSIHPNNYGHYIMSQAVIYAVSTGSVKINGTLTMQRGDINLQGTAGNIIRWNNDASNINNILFYDGGTTSSRVGIAKPTPNSQTGLALFVPDGALNSQGIMLSVNTDASNTTQTTSSLAIKADKSVLINQPISLAAASNISYPVTATGNHNVFLIYNNGTTNQRTGFGKFAGDGSAGLVLFAQNGIGSPSGIALGSGQDATSMTTSNASVWLKPDNNVVINLLKTGLTAPTTSGLIKNVVVDANGLLSLRDTVASGNTLYTGDGTLAGNRTISGAGFSLTADNITNFRVNADSYIFAKKNATIPYTGSIIGSGNIYEFGYTPTATVFTKGAGLFIDTNNNVGLAITIPTAIPLYATGNSAYVQGFQSNGANFYRVDSVTTDQTANLSQYYFRINAAGGNVTITLPSASTAFGSGMGITYVFKRLDSSVNSVTIQAASGNLIDGAGSFTLTAQYQEKEVQCVSSSSWDLK